MTIPPAEQQLTNRLTALLKVLLDSGISLLHQTTDHRFDMAEGASELWNANGVIGQVEQEIFALPIAEKFLDGFDRCVRGQSGVTFQFDLTGEDRRQFFQADMQRDETGVLTIIRDVTEKHAAELAMASLLREVSHRSKNLLAIVQSVAMQTAVHSGGVKEFLDKFRGRLHALSGTQDLVTESNWRGTQLQSLVSAQLTRVNKPPLAHFSLTGENPVLGPNASLHIGLAIHELAVNAVRHGAFSGKSSGHVEIDASFQTTEGERPNLVIQWTEDGIENGTAAASPRFGVLVLERIVPLSVGGSAEYRIDHDTVVYKLKVPADQYES